MLEVASDGVHPLMGGSLSQRRLLSAGGRWEASLATSSHATSHTVLKGPPTFWSKIEGGRGRRNCQKCLPGTVDKPLLHQRAISGGTPLDMALPRPFPISSNGCWILVKLGWRSTGPLDVAEPQLPWPLAILAGFAGSWNPTAGGSHIPHLSCKVLGYPFSCLK